MMVETAEIEAIELDTSIKKQETACPNLRRKIKSVAYAGTKRAIDILGGIVGCIILIPLTLIIATINFASGDRGPIFYVADRIGKNGKIFKMYKYRSMVEDADEKLAKYLAENEEARLEYETYKKLKHDPRVTKAGRFIRRTSLDEFPQFINVLKGEMSLVGPRPYLEKEKKDMTNTYNRIITVKPGITGLWQIRGRNDLTFEERLNLDKVYLDKRCLLNDIKILFKTMKKVVSKDGAI